MYLRLLQKSFNSIFFSYMGGGMGLAAWTKNAKADCDIRSISLF